VLAKKNGIAFFENNSLRRNREEFLPIKGPNGLRGTSRPRNDLQAGGDRKERQLVAVWNSEDPR